jgi:hypothetical protein
MYKYRLSFARKNYVRSTRQAFSVQSIPVTETVEQTSYGQFRACVFCADRLHNASALFTGSRVHI